VNRRLSHSACDDELRVSGVAVIDFYEGFEGEPEIDFTLYVDGVQRRTICIWYGYFDELLTRVQPVNGVWTGLALPFNLLTGWHEQTTWFIPDLSAVLDQWSRIPTRPEESVHAVHQAVLALLTDGVEYDGDVGLSYS
jgi:hypothetical protein